MRIRITSSIIGEDGAHWEPGTVYECSEPFALQMVAENRGTLVVDASSPVVVEHRDPALTTASAPAMSRRSRR